MSSTDTSDDEMTQKLRAAVAPQFSKVYTKNHHGEPSPEPKNSLRQCEEEQQFYTGGFTQEYRDHVANHLTRMVDMILEDKIKAPKHTGPVQKPKVKGGVKLFKHSQSYVKAKSKTDDAPPQKPKPRRQSESNISKSQLKACAVTIEQVQNETKAWSNRSKAPVYHYKQTAKGLEYQPPPFV